MNPVFRFLERIFIGREPNSLDLPLLAFTKGRTLCRRDFHKGLLVLGSPDSGKTTLARTLYRSLLRDEQGGLVLCVKAAQVEEFLHLCAREGRGQDCLVIAPGNGHRFNPLEAETDINEAAAFLGELAEVLSERTSGTGDDAAFWRTQLEIILRNLFKLCWLQHGRLDLVEAARLFESRANSSGQFADPVWRSGSALAKAIELAKDAQDDVEARLAADYFKHDFPAHGDRLQGSLAATVSGVFDALRRPPLCTVFSGKSTFSMEQVLNAGKICIVGMPVLDGISGRLANAILQFAFCRAATRRVRQGDAFLVSDECQETVSRELMKKLAVLREYRVGTVLLTQNLAVLDEKIGEKAREGLLGLLSTKIFAKQTHAATRQWATEQIGKHQIKMVTRSHGSSSGGNTHSGRSSQLAWEDRVPPLEFVKLPQGETICLKGADFWRARWHRENPGHGGTVGIID